MNIAFDHQIFSAQEYGGISRYFVELANQLALMKDTRVRVISPVYVNAYLVSRSPEVQLIGTKMPMVKRTGRIYRAINQALAKPLASLYQPDLVHETYYAGQGRVPKGCKVVVTVHDMIHERFPESFSKMATDAQDKANAVRRADHVICISEHTRKDLIQILGVDPEKTSVIYHGFALSQAHVPVESVVSQPFLLYVGSRTGYKNFSGLLQAYATSPDLLRNYKLVAFGGGALTDAELDLARRLGVPAGQLVQIPGGDDVLEGLYRHAAVFIYPSLYEGFGIPPLEAMSFDCPVVCSNTSSIPEVVGDAALMFDPLSPECIGTAISAVVGDEVMRQSLIVRGRERGKLFSWGACAQQTMSVYQRVLA